MAMNFPYWRMKKLGWDVKALVPDPDRLLHRIGLERRGVGADVLGACLWTLLGCGIGIVVGLAIAPKKGEELREDLGVAYQSVQEEGLRGGLKRLRGQFRPGAGDVTA